MIAQIKVHFGRTVALALMIIALTALSAAFQADEAYAADSLPVPEKATMVVNKKVAKPGTKLVFSVKFKGNVEGNPLLFIIPKDKNFKYFQAEEIVMKRKAGTNTFSGSYKVKKGMLPGEWQVLCMHIPYRKAKYDTDAGVVTTPAKSLIYANSKSVRSTKWADKRGNLSKADFKVVGTDADIDGPVLVKAKIAKNRAKVGKPAPALSITFKSKCGVVFSEMIWNKGKSKTVLGRFDGHLDWQLIRVRENTFTQEHFRDDPYACKKGVYRAKAIVVQDENWHRILYIDSRYKDEAKLLKKQYKIALNRDIKYTDLSNLDFTAK